MPSDRSPTDPKTGEPLAYLRPQGETLPVAKPKPPPGRDLTRAERKAPRLMIYPEGGEPRCLRLDRIRMASRPPRPVMLAKEGEEMVTVRLEGLPIERTTKHGAREYYKRGM